MANELIQLTDKHRVKWNGLQFILYRITTLKGEEANHRGNTIIAKEDNYGDVGGFPTLRLVCKYVMLDEFNEAVELHGVEALGEKWEELMVRKYDESVKLLDTWAQNFVLGIKAPRKDTGLKDD